MENNEENLGSQEPVNEPVSQPSSETKTTNTTTTTTKSFNTKTLIIVAVIIAAIAFVFFNFFTRSAKSTVKDFVKAMDNGKEKNFAKLIDYEGYKVLSTCRTYKDGEYVYDFEKFESKYEEALEELKDMDKDEKEEYKEKKEAALETLAKMYLDDDNEYKLSIKKIDAKAEKDYKKVTKVTAKIQSKDEDGDTETNTYIFYTIKKGLKNYMISMPMAKK